MKISNLLNFKPFYQSISKKELPIKTAYKLSKLVKVIDENLEFYQDKLSEIIQEYGLRDDNGNIINVDNSIKIIEGKETECTKKISELNDLDVELPDITFDLDEFNDVNISVEDMNILSLFIKE